jgi:hypothetical protein
MQCFTYISGFTSMVCFFHVICQPIVFGCLLVIKLDLVFQNQISLISLVPWMSEA